MKRSRIVVITILVVLVGVGIVFLVRDAGPYHDGRSIASWFEQVLEHDGEKEKTALEALAAMGTNGVVFLRKELTCRDGGVKRFFMELDRRLRFVDWSPPKARQRRKAAVQVIGQLDGLAAHLRTELLEAFHDRENFVESGTFLPALSQLGSDGIPSMLKAARSLRGRAFGGSFILIRAVDEILRNEQVSESLRQEVYQRVRPLLSQGSHINTTAVALQLMRQFPDHAEAIVVTVTERLPQYQFKVRSVALSTLASLGVRADLVVPAVTKELNTPSPGLKTKALKVLAVFKDDAAPSVPVITSLVRDPTISVRMEALRTLRLLGGVAESAFDDVVQVLQTDDESTIRVEAIKALVALGQSRDRTVNVLEVAVRDEDGYVRRSAIVALGELGAEAAPAVDTLIAALQESREDIQTSAIQALGLIGEPARKAVPHILTAWDSNQSALAPYVRDAVSRINGTELPLP